MKVTAPIMLGFGFTLATSICGCEASKAPTTTEYTVASPTQQAATQTDSSDQLGTDKSTKAVSKAEATEEGVINSVTGLIGDAADAGMNAASDSADYVGDLFHSLKDKGLTTADDTKQWVQEDFQAMGAWDYKVVVLPDSTEEMEQQLNELGRDRWECFEVKDKTFFLKRPRKSYLRNVPMKDLIKLVPMMQGDN